VENAVAAGKANGRAYKKDMKKAAAFFQGYRAPASEIAATPEAGTNAHITNKPDGGEENMTP